MQWRGHELHASPSAGSSPHSSRRSRRDCARSKQSHRRGRERELGGIRRHGRRHLVHERHRELEAADGHLRPDDAGAASAFWVGLGGYSTTSQTLEQIGTSADCDSQTGEPSYYAWYELVPNASVTIPKFTVHPGDLITTSVNIVDDGSSVTLQVKDRTTKKTYTTTLPFANADLSSAEWVAEAPAGCNEYRCRQLSLSNFGSVQFSKIAALGNSIGGTLTANPGWTTTAISLIPSAQRGYFPGPDRFSSAASSTAGATSAEPTTDGRGFTVSWSPSPSTSQPPLSRGLFS